MTGISTSQKTASIKVGDTRKITVATVPEDADDSSAVIKAVTWKSSDDGKATVTPDGTIKGVAEGKATVTATSGLLNSSVVVTVTKA